MYLLAYEWIKQRQFTPVNEEIIGVNWRDMKCTPYNWNMTTKNSVVIHP